MERYIYDLELYPNYFLAVFQDVATLTVTSYDQEDLPGLLEFMCDNNKEFVGFNNFEFDDMIIKWMISEYVAGGEPTAQELFDLSQKFIVSKKAGVTPKSIQMLTYYPGEEIVGEKDYDKALVPWARSLDCMKISLDNFNLKQHGAAMHMLNLQDLPYPVGAILTDEEMVEVHDYCINDIDTTMALYNKLKSNIKTRDDLLELYPFMMPYSHSMKDSQIAQRFMVQMYLDETGIKMKDCPPPDTYVFDCDQDIQDGIFFNTKKNQVALDNLRSMGRIHIPSSILIGGKRTFDDSELRNAVGSCTFTFGDGDYSIGLGGLHSNVESVCAVSPDGCIAEADVTSYYPHLILNFDEAPSHLNRTFLSIFKGIIDLRLQYKAQGNKSAADSLKIVINSIYGKLGDKFSPFLDLRLQYMVTINGQLWLLMLAEMLHDAGYHMFMGNTDGIYFDLESRDNEDNITEIVNEWAELSDLPIEPVFGYTALIIQNVNSYAACLDGKWKLKKTFALNQKMVPEIISKSILRHLVDGVSIEDAVRESDDILDYVYCKGVSSSTTTYVTDKVTWGDTEVQRINRFYKSNGECHQIIQHKTMKDTNVKAQAKVTNSDNCVIVNKLVNTDIPADLDYSFYELELRKMASSILNENPFSREFGFAYTPYTSNRDNVVVKGWQSWDQIVDKFMTTSHLELANKADAPAFNMTVWNTEGIVTRHPNGDIRRGKHNAIGIDALVLDFDNKNLKPSDPGHFCIADAEATYSQFEYILYTSYSHSARRDKYRMIFPLTKALRKCELEAPSKTPIGETSILPSLHQLFPDADVASMKIAQIFYEPSCKPDAMRHLSHNVGEFFDPDLYLDQSQGSQRTASNTMRTGDVGGKGEIFYETFDYLQYCKDKGAFKKTLSPGKHSIACAFCDEHSSVPGKVNGFLNDTETVVFVTGDSMQGSHCTHEHGSEISTAIRVAKKLEGIYGSDHIRPYCHTKSFVVHKRKAVPTPEETPELTEAFKWTAL